MLNESQHNVFMSPADPLTKGICIFCDVFFGGNLGFLKAQISTKRKTANYPAKKKTPFVNGSSGAHRTRVKKFEIYTRVYAYKAASFRLKTMLWDSA